MRLLCRFNSEISPKDVVFYWMVKWSDSRQDVIMMNDVSYGSSHYTVDFAPQDGRYDLTVSRAEYKRDNTQFECRMKNIKEGSVNVLATFSVTVLCKYIRHYINFRSFLSYGAAIFWKIFQHFS